MEDDNGLDSEEDYYDYMEDDDFGYFDPENDPNCGNEGQDSCEVYYQNLYR